jgi:putative proteasome-type protease
VTYCLGIKVREGLIVLADGRITAGATLSTSRKLTFHGQGDRRFCVMTSGLRSLRDKTLAYLDRAIRRDEATLNSMLDVTTAYTRCLRQVTEEDKEALARSSLLFDLNAIIGGQLPDDEQPTMFLVYSEGNWIEMVERTPYLSVGAIAYGKPILDRALRYDTPLRTALKLAYLSFDSTRFSSADVGFPIDLATYSTQDRGWREAQYDYDDLAVQRQWWNEHLTELAQRMPDGPWVDTLLPAGTIAPPQLAAAPNRD